MLGSRYLTKDPDPDKARQLAASVPGMAHLALTGPPGTTCGIAFIGKPARKIARTVLPEIPSHDAARQGRPLHPQEPAIVPVFRGALEARDWADRAREIMPPAARAPGFAFFRGNADEDQTASASTLKTPSAMESSFSVAMGTEQSKVNVRTRK